MKKILSLTLVALTLCMQHESSAMGNLRNYAGRFGQQCKLLYTQGAQRVAPAYRTLTTGFSNLRPQISQQWRNMQTSARNWSQNLNLPTARTTALGLGGAGLGAAYLRPNFFGVAGAEEEVPVPQEIIKHSTTYIDTTPAGLEGPAGPIGGASKKEEITPSNQLDNIRRQLNELITKPHPQSQHSLDEFRWKLRFFLNDHEANMDPSTRQKFTALVNDFLNMKNEDLNEDLKDSIIDAGSTNKGIVNFLGDVIQHDILFANASYGTQSKIPNIIIPDIYKKFFKDISNDNMLKAEFIKSINDMKKGADIVLKKELAQQPPQQKDEILNTFSNLNRILDAIAKEVHGSSSFWSYFGY